MKFPLSWLKEFVDLNASTTQVIKYLTMCGIEVDHFEKMVPNFKQVVVAEVISTASHPNADKLTVAQVFDGTNTYQVVCGASNCRPNIKTALALVGATLLDENKEIFKIKKTKLRGVESYGMLCSAEELHLPSQQEGILELNDHLTIGSDLADLYSDTLLDLSFTPNLNYAASVLGTARELAAMSSSTFKEPVLLDVNYPSPKKNFSITIEAFKECCYYAYQIIDLPPHLKTPDLIQYRLNACGIKIIHPIVDILNYVLLERGYPLHAFDLEQIDEALYVRKAFLNEKIITLDSKERLLNEEMLVVADKSQALAIAGILGGKKAEVTSQTKRILIEAAYFIPSSIRKTAQKLSISTDASKRFERSVDPKGALIALKRVIQLLEKFYKIEIKESFQVIDQQTNEDKSIKCRPKRVNQILGTNLSQNEIENFFKRLNFSFYEEANDSLVVKIPSYRVDLVAEIDLIEEIARLVGYENIVRKKASYLSSHLPNHPLYLLEKKNSSKFNCRRITRIFNLQFNWSFSFRKNP